LLASMVIHAHSWFEIMPKTMPMLYLRGERVSAPAIRRTGWIATVVVTLAVLALAAWWPR
jgi:fumarate reductase subunit C